VKYISIIRNDTLDSLGIARRGKELVVRYTQSPFVLSKDIRFRHWNYSSSTIDKLVLVLKYDVRTYYCTSHFPVQYTKDLYIRNWYNIATTRVLLKLVHS
jgi:hypothetical protein